MTAVSGEGRGEDRESGGSGGGPRAELGAPAVPTSDELSEAVVQLHAAEVAVHQRLLKVVRTFDDAGHWRTDGAHSMADWLVARLAIERRTAHEWVRVAHALSGLPAIARVAGEGRLSWDQLAPLTRLATAGDDEALAAEAPGWSAAHTRSMAACVRPPRVTDANQAHQRRYLRWWSDEHVLHLRGQLPVEAGAAVTTALTRIAAESTPDPASGLHDAFDARAADALCELASQRLADDADADRATVVVHADAAVLAGDESGVAELEDGPRLAAVTARRLACDCRWQLVAEDDGGGVVRLGRTTRQVPAWMVRQLRQRDRGCRFPGCGRTRWVHAHHQVHWTDGGPTDLDNLALLCSHHHRFVHEGGWSVTSGAEGELVFTHPNGRTFATGPPPLRPDVRQRLFGPDPPAAA